MKEKYIIITNNKNAKEYFEKNCEVVNIDGKLIDVLYRVRDLVHIGHRLLTHPLMGSIKPNQTPYKSVAVSLVKGDSVDLDSLMYIENSIESTIKLLNTKPLRDWPERILEDYRVIDLDLIKNAL